MKNFNYDHFPSGKWVKLLVFMKLQLVLMCVCSLGTLTAASVAAQTNTVDVSYRQQSLVSVLEDLQSRTDCQFLYFEGVLPQRATVTLVHNGATIEHVLDNILKQHGLSYTRRDNVFVISRMQGPLQQTQQQVRAPATGVVRNAAGVPVIGATVVVKGDYSFGTATGSDGGFTLRLPSGSSGPVTLEVSYVGMQSKDVVWDGTPLTVVLEETTNAIDAVVVTGFFERKAESFTGSAASFSGEQLRQVSTQNVFQALRSLDPSVMIFDNDLYGSDPNRLPDIDVRGKTSINDPRDMTYDPNQPYYIIDDFPATAEEVVNLNVNRVESITILKDAASTAIYGSKAANGVIVIKTVQPQPGRLRTSYDGQVSVEFADLSVYNLMNSMEKVQAELLSGVYENATYTIGLYDLQQMYNDNLEKALSGVNSYWLKVPIRTGISHKHNLTIGGGTESMTYGINVNYSNTQGVMKKSGNHVVGGTVDLTYRTANGKFRFSNKLNLSWKEAFDPPVSFEAYAQTNPYHEIPHGKDQPQFFSAYRIRQSEGPTGAAEVTYRTSNPLYNETLNYLNENQSLYVKENFYAEWRPFDGLMVKGNFQIAPTRLRSEIFESPYHTKFVNHDTTEKGRYSKSTSDGTEYHFNMGVTYNKALAEKHNIFANGTMDFSSRMTIKDSFEAIGFTDDIVPYPSFAGMYPTTAIPTYTQDQARQANFFITTGYSYDNRYMFDLTYRIDGANNFGRDELFQSHWSTGVSWNLHREKFLEGKINRLKLRFTVGMVGNTGAVYNTTTTYRIDNQNNIWGNGATVNHYGSYGLKGAKTLDINAGLDVTTRDNRLSLTFDIYRKITDPMILTADRIPSTAHDGLKVNMGRNTGDGLDFKINYNAIYRPEQDFVWAIGLSGSMRRAKYSKMPPMEELNELLRSERSTQRYYNGGSQYAIWAVPSAGIDPATGDEIFIKPDGTYTFTYDARYERLVGNDMGGIDGRINSSLRWRGLQVSFFLHYTFDRDKMNDQLRRKVEGLTPANMLSRNQDRRALYDRWTSVGQHAKYRRITDLKSTSYPSSRWLQTENVLDGESISVSWQFDEEPWVERIGLESFKVSATFNDIFEYSTIRREKGINYPYARMATLSLNVTF